MQDEPHVFDLLPGYALGALDTGDTAAVETHLAGCLTCRAELRDFEAVTADLALPLPQEAPAPDAKLALMARIQTLPAPAKPAPVRAPARPARFSLPRLLPAWGALSLALVLVLAVGNVLLLNRLNHTQSLTGPLGMQAVALSNAPAAPKASGIVIISADGENGVLVVDSLPTLGPTEQYQIWLLRDDQRTAGPVFNVDKTGYRGTRIIAPASLLSYTSVQVSVEPVSGSDPMQIGRIVLEGSLHVR